MTLKSQNKNCKKTNDLIKIICLQRPINFSGKSNFGKNTLKLSIKLVGNILISMENWKNQEPYNCLLEIFHIIKYE